MGFYFTKHNQYPDQILIRNFTDTVDLPTIKESWNNLKKNQLVTSITIGIINDLRKCTIRLTMDEFSILRQLLNNQKALERIKMAVITDSPKIIVFPFMLHTQETKILVRPFSTYEAAEKWILS